MQPQPETKGAALAGDPQTENSNWGITPGKNLCQDSSLVESRDSA